MLSSHSVQGEPSIPEPTRCHTENSDAPPTAVAHRLDFVQLGLPEYKNKFAMVIDNLFTPEDCVRYIAKVESEKEWEEAGIGDGGNARTVDTSYRHSSRILYDTKELANEMFEKLRPYLGDIEHMKYSPLHVKPYQQARKQPARLVSLNPRLRFLKYGPGQFFNKHCDCTYSSRSGEHISYYTLQLYLNGSADELKGGATRFWKMGNVGGPEKRKSRPGMPLQTFVDIEPRVGRALIFEQLGLVHSGEVVFEGTKITVRTDLMFEVCSSGVVEEAREQVTDAVL